MVTSVPTNRTQRKITFFISSFHAGGGEKQVIEIANFFAERGHDTDLVVLQPVGEYGGHVDGRVSVISLEARRMILSLPGLIAYLRRRTPCVLLAMDEYTQLLSLAACALTRADTRVVLRIGTVYSELFRRRRGIKSALTKFFIRRFYRYADAIIGNSKGVADDIATLASIPRDRITVIYNPKDVDSIRAQSREALLHPWFAHKTAPIVIAAGRLREEPKNFALLIRAFARASKDIPARLLILGAGRDEGRLRALIAGLGCEERVLLPGHVDNPYAHLGKSDLFVSTSLWEGFPNALQEALVCSLPVIASDCSSGPREILAPESDYRLRLSKGAEYARYGVLTAVNDENALVEAMKKLLSEEQTRIEYAQKAGSRGDDFDRRKIINDYERVMIPDTEVLKQKRIAFVMSRFLAGGGQRVMIDVANWIAAKGYAVDLLVLFPFGRYATHVSKDVRVVSLSAKRPVLSIFKMIAYLRREQPFSMLALDDNTQLLSLAGRMLAGAHTRVLLRIGSMLSVLYREQSGIRKILAPFLSRRLYPRADGIIAVSQGVARDVEKLFTLPEERIKVIFNPKELDTIRQRAREPVDHPWLAAGRDLPVIITSGRVHAVKDSPTLFRAFAKVQSSVPSRLMIVGEGREEEKLRILARELGIEDLVCFTGYKENPHVYVARADVFVLTSTREGLPNSLIEALVCGVPVIATDCDSGPREILAPESDVFMRRSSGIERARFGILVPVGDSEVLAQALILLLTDSSLRRKYQRAARERAEIFDATKIRGEYLRALTSSF